MDIHYLKLSSGAFATPCLFILSKKYSSGRLLGSSNRSAEISALVFCSMMLQQVPVENPKFSKIVNGYVFDFIKLHEELLFK